MMKNRISIFCLALLLLLALAGIVSAAGLSPDTGSAGGTGGVSQNGQAGTNMGANSSLASGLNNSSGLQSGMNIQQGIGVPSGMSIPPGMSIPSNITPDMLRAYLQQNMTTPGDMGTAALMKSDQKGALSLKADPGDGLVSLTWKITGLQQKPGDPPLQFSILYGTLPGRYDRKTDVGSVTDFKVRDLKNNQAYFFKVLAYSTGGTPVYSAGGMLANPAGGTLSNSAGGMLGNSAGGTLSNSAGGMLGNSAGGMLGNSAGGMVILTSNEERAMPLALEDLASSLEKLFARDVPTQQDKYEADPFNRELKQFGYDFFKNSIPIGMPIDHVPVGPDYVIGPGDTVRIDLWGSVNAHYELDVDKNGEISIPKVGTVKVWGLKYGQAKDVIHRAIGHFFRGFESNVSLGTLRSIQAFVVGEVTAPGTYTISSLSTVINVLAMAGGPSKNGSLRSIKLFRKGQPVQEIDLYEMFLGGDRSKDVRIENGDTVFVPVIGAVAAVGGEVKRPAIYELKGKTSVDQLLAMAGDITATGDVSRIQIERFGTNGMRVALDFEMDRKQKTGRLASEEVRDRDMVKIFPINRALRDVVSLQGNVVKPGGYQFRKGMKLTDVIPNVDALLPDTYLDAVQITRLAPPNYHPEIVSADLGKALAGDARENVALQEQDVITVYPRLSMEEKKTVSISGEVVTPGDVDYYPNMTVRDLIVKAGSLKSTALLDRAELTRIVMENGRARATRMEIDLRKVMAGDPAQNLAMQPYDSLIVRRVENWLEATDRFVTLTGEVRFPGIYSFSKGEKLSSVIERAGGYTDDAYLKGARFFRKSVQETQQKRMEEIITRTEQDVVQKQEELAASGASKEEIDATKAALERVVTDLQRLKNAKAEGRVVIKLSALNTFTSSPYDLELRGGDVLDIPQTPSVVYVFGQVFSPSTLVYIPQRDVEYYLKKAGGPTNNAEEGEMYVIKADGSVISRAQSSAGISWNDDAKRWTFGGFLSTSLDPGDTVVVPQQLEHIAWMKEIKDITTILSQIALAAGVAVAAGL